MFPGVDTDKLDRWEEDFTRDVYSIEEKVEDYLAVSSNSKKTEKRSSSRKKKTISAIEEEIREADSSEVEETGDDVSGKEETEQEDSTETEKEKVSHDKVPEYSKERQIPTSSPSEVKSVDSWIDELTEFVETKLPDIDEIGEMAIATTLFKIEARKDMPPVETPKFSGDPLDYVEFIETFKIHVHEKATLRDDQRMGHLKMALRGKAEESIKGLGSSGIMYATALKSIKREFGQSSVIVRAQINRITRGDVIRPNNRDSLRTFSLDIINCIAKLKRHDRLSDANLPEFLRQVVRKLPAYLVDRWKTRAMEIRDRGGNPDLHEISTFIQRNVRAQFDPDYGDLFRDSRPVQVKKGVNANTPVSNNKFIKSCKVCGQTDHSHVRYCSKFKSCSVEDRFKSAKEHRLCYSCLMYGHKTRDCRNKKSCGVNDCQRTHHSLLHVASGTSALDRDSILPVVRVRFRADNGRVREGNVLIDSGAGTTIIRKEFARQLGLQGKKEGLNISVVGGRNQQQQDSRRVGFWISPLDGAEEYRVEAHELDKTIAEVSQVDKRWLSSFNHLKDIKLTHREGPVDLILGVQYTHLHVEQESREGLAFEPVAKNTRLGWVVIGSEYRNSHKPSIATIAFCMNSVQEDVKFLYEVETVGVQAADCKCPKMPLEDKKVLDFFESSFKIENKRCSIGLPWARDPSELPNNFAYAKRRLYSLEQSLDRNPVKKEAYRKVMNDYVQRGWAEEVHENTTENVFYLPHHGVVNIEKPSTLLRVVFNSAALYQGASLKKFLHKGPSTLIDLFGILIRFREERVGFMGDISKMFLQICLHEEDTQYHRYLWRDTDTTREPSIYRLLRVMFGDKPSPEMANFVMRKLAELNEGDYLEAAEILKRDRYMDDLIHSCKSSDEAEQKMAGIDKVLAQGSFSVKEWHSLKKKSTNEKVDITGDKRVKTLGVVWCCEKDTIHFNVKSLLGADYTKRSVLSKLSMLFDPLGLVTIRARIAMQEIWKMKDVG